MTHPPRYCPSCGEGLAPEGTEAGRKPCPRCGNHRGGASRFVSVLPREEEGPLNGIITAVEGEAFVEALVEAEMGRDSVGPKNAGKLRAAAGIRHRHRAQARRRRG